MLGMASSSGAGSSSDWVSETARRLAGRDVTEARSAGVKRWRAAQEAADAALRDARHWRQRGASQTPPPGEPLVSALAQEETMAELAREANEYARTVLAAKPLAFDGATGLRMIEGRPVQARPWVPPSI